MRSSTEASRVPSQYALARSAALVVVAAVSILSASTEFAASAAIAMIAVQSFDAVIGGLRADRVKTFGPAFTALANAVALVWLLTS
ncbi:hypothetical protein E3O42_00030 [Cryobacterium adonitolivorans]|uniref:DUF1304 family protein n=1 Tax=Cryobacterium adonitolivorans TaxID=1259189 RepID=A0A4R8WCY9_9MICO|nr:hypothetical protein E3O42_00030 [Cryobacterium adonitolivorans]